MFICTKIKMFLLVATLCSVGFIYASDEKNKDFMGKINKYLGDDSCASYGEDEGQQPVTHQHLGVFAIKEGVRICFEFVNEHFVPRAELIDKGLNTHKGTLAALDKRVKTIEKQNFEIKTYATVDMFKKLIDENNGEIQAKIDKKFKKKETSLSLGQMIHCKAYLAAVTYLKL